MKTGLVLEGGGLRGIFSAGVMDVLMEEGIEFDGGIGVSAGAAFGCNYKSKQPRRSIRYNMRFAKDPRYSSLRSLLATGDLFNAQFCYHDIPEKLFPFDWETFRENPMKFYLVCTDVETGKPVYHLCDEQDEEYEMLEWFRASGSMPLVSRIVRIGGKKLLDGGISDSIPLRFMEEQGYERNLVILTRPSNYVKSPNSMMPVIRRAFRSYPATIQAMNDRHIVYNETLAYIRAREAGKYALVIRPETDLDIGRIEHDRFKIRAAYKEGRRIARHRLPEIRRFLHAAKAGGFDAEDAAFSAGQEALAGNTGDGTAVTSIKPSLVDSNAHDFTGPVKPSLVEDPAFTGQTAETSNAAEGTVEIFSEISDEAETRTVEDTPTEKRAADSSSIVDDPEFVLPAYIQPHFEARMEEPVEPKTETAVVESAEPESETAVVKPAEQETTPAYEKPAEPESETAVVEPSEQETETAVVEPADHENTTAYLETVNSALALRNARKNKGRAQKKTWKPGEIRILRQEKEEENKS